MCIIHTFRQALDGDGKPSVSNVIEGRYYMEKEKGLLGETTTTRFVSHNVSIKSIS